MASKQTPKTGPDRRTAGMGALAGLALGLAGQAQAASKSAARRWKTLSGKAPIIIAHRGASGEMPEHTLRAYQRAIELGADYIEPDLVFTRDGVLVCRHENEISQTTNVADKSEFAARKTTKVIDGETLTGWFTEDFTLEELKTLTCKERLPQLRPANTAFDGQDTIPTFAEVIALAQAQSRATGRVIGVYPETKHPTYFLALGKLFEYALPDVLSAHGWAGADAPVIIQSFEVDNLVRLGGQVSVRLVQLVADSGGPVDAMARGGPDYRAMLTPKGLAHIRRYAHGIGPQKTLILPRDGQERTGKPTRLVAQAHKAGLLVHPWTFRQENYFLPAQLRRGDPQASSFLAQPGDLAAEIDQFLSLGVDGLFTDFTGAGVAARKAWSAR